HLDPRQVGVEESVVVEKPGTEVGSQSPVDDAEDIPVEPGGDPGGVVIGRLQDGRWLDEVGSQEKEIVFLQEVGDPAHEGDRILSVQISDGASQESDQPPPALGNPVQSPGEVPGEALDPQGLVAAGQVQHYPLEGVGADVQRQEVP